MPLPKPPAKRASLLSAADFDSQAAPQPGKRPSFKTRAAAEPAAPALLELTDSTSAAIANARLPASAAPIPMTAHAGLAPLRRPQPAKPEARARKPRGNGPATLFVLDTNVLMHDPTSLFRFEEHDIYLPMITLEELDGHKRGMTEVSRNARQVSRELDALAATMPTRDSSGMSDGLPLARTGHREAGGKLFFQTNLINVQLPAGLPQGKADNQILGVVQALREQQPGRDVVLVSKDINMRIKARALGLPAEDYFNDKTLEDGDLLYTGVLALPADFWDKHGKTMESWQQAASPTTASAGRWCRCC
jgi:PhoH-like ATPase